MYGQRREEERHFRTRRVGTIGAVHAKDGDWPPKDVPGALGTERPLGKGSVGMERFVRALSDAGFQGPLNVERESEDHASRIVEIRQGIELLRTLVAAL